jgi:outer membrane protein assembly factor BamB
VNAATQQIIWKQDNFDAIKGLTISDDKKMVYVVQLNSVDQSLPAPVQALTALDLKTGSVRWTFQPSGQASFVNPQSDGFQYSNGILFATLCMPDGQSSCARERLYAIDAATGNALWKFEAQSIFDLQVSADGSTVLLQTHSTEWINLIGHFRS